MIEQSDTQIGDTPLAIDAGDAMHLHRPKPLHGVREIATEIGVIVVGIVIALLGEQTVEALHWRENVNQAEIRLRRDAREVQFDMIERIDIQGCLDRRLVSLKAQLLASGSDWKPPTPFITSGPPAGSIYAHPMEPWPNSAWLNAVASTTSTHLPEDEQSQFSEIFAAAQRSAGDQAAEHEQSSELNLLGSPMQLTPDEKFTFLRITEAERARNRLLAYEARNALEAFSALHMDIPKVRAEVHRSLFYRTCVQDGLA